MDIRRERVLHTLQFFEELSLISAAERSGIVGLLAPEFIFRAQLEVAESIHAHVKVSDTVTLPHDAIRNAGGRAENAAPGYIKYAFPSSLNVIFSSIPVAEEDRLGDTAGVPKPFLDHAGVDMRSETARVRRRFEAVVDIAGRNGWRHVSQGGSSRAVFCCHTQVNEKHWVYPPTRAAGWNRPLEFAFGALLVHPSSMGCDLRPAHPELKLTGPCCATAATRVPAAVAAACCATSCVPNE